MVKKFSRFFPISFKLCLSSTDRIFTRIMTLLQTTFSWLSTSKSKKTCTFNAKTMRWPKRWFNEILMSFLFQIPRSFRSPIYSDVDINRLRKNHRFWLWKNKIQRIYMFTVCNTSNSKLKFSCRAFNFDLTFRVCSRDASDNRTLLWRENFSPYNRIVLKDILFTFEEIYQLLCTIW